MMVGMSEIEHECDYVMHFTVCNLNVFQISNLIQRSCDALVRKLGEHSDTGKSVDLYR